MIKYLMIGEKQQNQMKRKKLLLEGVKKGD
jgi:preprotein translocase subunit YajC